MTKSRHRGITIIELLVAVTIAVLVLGGLWRILRQGTRVSLRGMLHVNTTLEARRVLRQVGDDLRRACIELNGSKITLDFAKVVNITGLPPLQSYQFLNFPIHGEVGDIIPAGETGQALRRASRITYSLEPNVKLGMKCLNLVRTEQFHPEHPFSRSAPAGQSRILSSQVQFFSIKPMTYSSGGRSLNCYFITLQLAEIVPPASLPDPKEPIVRSPDVVVADFFDTVYPEFFNGLVQRGKFNPNWHSGVSGK